MKKLYDEYFHVPENGKISDKVMIVRVVTTVIIMIVCMAAMSISAYAYFSSNNVISSSNVIRSANFDIEVTVKDGDGNEIVKKDVNSKTYSAELKAENELKAEKTYTVTIAYDSANSTAETGFCIIEAGGKTYHTQQIWKNATEGRYTSITFEITVTEDTTVEFTPHWGTSSYYPDFKENGGNNELYITNGECIELAINNDNVKAISEPNDEIETSASDITVTEPPETTTDTTVTEIIHTVVSGENLTKIANQYNTTVSRIVAYNGITDPNIIYKGQLLKIPPADWEIPEDISEQT